MKKNMGSVDRIVRLLFVVLIVVLYFTNVISGIVAIILGIFTVISLFTCITGVCPAYHSLGISTNKKKEEA
ncbi:MAG: DUF2892 domain-containing protein [Ignavibacteriaceae bacterium]|nr:DUF2892 domain-containing protein [Ignavibacteriaceae bacterium]